jgi:AcrR family transcriptional regulator
MATQIIDDVTLIEALFDVFRNRGYEGATLAILSEMTGLKKSSLYHRFPAGKEDMVKAVVQHVTRQLNELILEPLRDNSVSPKERFDQMLVTISAFYNDGKKNCLLNVLNLGETKPEIKAILYNDYNSWLTALINLGKEAGMKAQEANLRALHFLIVVEGALVVQRVTSDETTFKNSMEYEKSLFFNFSG